MPISSEDQDALRVSSVHELPAGMKVSGLQLNPAALPTAANSAVGDINADLKGTPFVFVSGSGYGVIPVTHYARIDAALALVDDTSTQALFPAGYDTFAVTAGETYRFRLVARLTKGANSVSLAYITTLATATMTSFNAVSHGISAASATAAASAMNNIESAATHTVVAAGTGVNIRLTIEGEFEVNAAGTISPTVAFSGATGATPSVNVGTFFEVWRVGTNPVTSFGTFA